MYNGVLSDLSGQVACDPVWTDALAKTLRKANVDHVEQIAKSDQPLWFFMLDLFVYFYAENEPRIWGPGWLKHILLQKGALSSETQPLSSRIMACL